MTRGFTVTGVLLERAKEPNSRLLATVSIVINDCLVVREVKLIRGARRIWVAFPSRRSPDGKYVGIVHATNRAARTQLENAILAAYRDDNRGTEGTGVSAPLPTLPKDLVGRAAFDPGADHRHDVAIDM